MNKFIRTISLLLIIVTLVGLLCACGGNKSQGPDVTATEQVDPAQSTIAEDTTGGQEPPKDLHALDVLGERDLAGETITFLNRSGGNMWDIASLYAEDYLSEAINDAAFDRNQRLEQQYGFEVKIIPSGATSYPKKAENMILAGAEFDVLTACAYDMTTLSVKAVLRDLKQINTLQLDQAWWNRTLNEQLTVANSLYYVSGDIICEDSVKEKFVLSEKRHSKRALQ